MADLEKIPVVDVEKTVEETDSGHIPPTFPQISIAPTTYRKLIWKLDARLLPPLFSLWFVSLIDRVNIGTAKIQGLEADLGMDPKSNQFNVAVVLIFVGLITCEVPSNWLMKRFRPSVVLCAETFLLGIFTLGQGLVTSYGGLVAMRFLIGVCEAGLIPGSVYLLGQYYPRYNLQWRMSMLMVGNAVSSAFGGLLAYAIANIHSANGYKGWRWIFIIEGCMSIGVTLLAYPFMSDWPETAKWLSPDENLVLADRIRQDGMLGRMDRLDRRAIKRIVLDWKVWVCAAIYIGTDVTLYSINLFAPTIVTQFSTNKDPRYVQSLVIPIFLASAVGCLAVAYASDRMKHRYGWTMFGYALTFSGILIMINQKSVSINTKYGALYLMSVGAYISLPLLWLMLVNNVSGTYKIAFAIGMEIGVGNIGGIVAALVFQGSEAPFYTTGYNVSLGVVCAAALLATVSVFALWRENKARDAGKRDHLLSHPDADNLGDDHPHFRYGY